MSTKDSSSPDVTGTNPQTDKVSAATVGSDTAQRQGYVAKFSGSQRSRCIASDFAKEGCSAIKSDSGFDIATFEPERCWVQGDDVYNELRQGIARHNLDNNLLASLCKNMAQSEMTYRDQDGIEIPFGPETTESPTQIEFALPSDDETTLKKRTDAACSEEHSLSPIQRVALNHLNLFVQSHMAKRQRSKGVTEQRDTWGRGGAEEEETSCSSRLTPAPWRIRSSYEPQHLVWDGRTERSVANARHYRGVLSKFAADAPESSGSEDSSAQLRQGSGPAGWAKTLVDVVSSLPRFRDQ